MAAQMNLPNRSWVVLVVDDNCDAADSLAQFLRHAGHQVAVAHTGMSAIACVRTCQPEDIRRSLEAGFDAHVAKPATPADLERWLT